MANQSPPGRTLISKAYEGDVPPPHLSAPIVSLIELCNRAMPDPALLRKAIVEEAKFDVGPPERAAEMARVWALDNKLVSAPVRNLRHEVFGRDRYGDPVIFLLSVGESEGNQIVFCSVLFRGAIEADVVKALVKPLGRQPFGGGMVKNADGHTVRRVFWDVEGAGGVRGIVACGPENVEALEAPRAVIAFNTAAARAGG